MNPKPSTQNAQISADCATKICCSRILLSNQLRSCITDAAGSPRQCLTIGFYVRRAVFKSRCTTMNEQTLPGIGRTAAARQRASANATSRHTGIHALPRYSSPLNSKSFPAFRGLVVPSRKSSSLSHRHSSRKWLRLLAQWHVAPSSRAK